MSDKINYTEEDLADLTDEERAGLQEEMNIQAGMVEDDTDEDQQEENQTDDTDIEEDDESQNQDFDDGNLGDEENHLEEDDEQAQEDEVPEQEEEEGAGEQQQADDDINIEYEPLISAPNVEQEIEEKYEQKRQIAEQFDDGEITAREKAEQEIQIDKQIHELRVQQDKAQRSYDDALSGWTGKHVPEFMKENPQFKPNSRLTSLLNEEVIALQRGHFAGNPFHPAILKIAKENLIKEWGEDIVGAAARPKQKQEPEKELKKVKKNRPAMPPTLKNVPSAISEDVINDGGKFAALDRLASIDREKYEAELEKLTPEQLDQYMQSS